MRYFCLDSLGDSEKLEEYCFLENAPKGISSICLTKGRALRDRHPDGWGEVLQKLGEDHPGLVLPSFIGNVDRMLVCSKPLADAILAHDLGDVEVVPFVLLNHRSRVHSRDYVFLNPIGTRDVLHMSGSEFKRHDDGEIFKIVRMVLDSKKLTDIPDLFRLREYAGDYIFSEKLVTDLRKREFTNLVFDELEVR